MVKRNKTATAAPATYAAAIRKIMAERCEKYEKDKDVLDNYVREHQRKLQSMLRPLIDVLLSVARDSDLSTHVIVGAADCLGSSFPYCAARDQYRTGQTGCVELCADFSSDRVWLRWRGGAAITQAVPSEEAAALVPKLLTTIAAMATIRRPALCVQLPDGVFEIKE